MQTFHVSALTQQPTYQELLADLTHQVHQKTKPIGALGQLEAMAIQIGLIQQTLTPTLSQPTILVFAGDHGIANSGVSPYPQAVTAQMVLNFLNGGAAINVFCKQNRVKLRVVDAGVNHVFDAEMPLSHHKIGFGTANFASAPAMRLAQVAQAFQVGAALVDEEIAQGCNVLAFGEMGIGNTSSASCLMSVLLGLPIEACVGRGTGLDDDGVLKKAAILSAAIAHHDLDNQDTLTVLATFGGFEIAMMVGAMLQAAQQKTLLLVDGFIASAALLVASKLAPNVLDYCVFAHCSDEAAHRQLLAHFHAKPLLDIGLRLGEGTGAVLAYPLVQAAVNFLNDMASFDSAGVSTAC